MAERIGCAVVPVDRPQEAAEDLPIVVTATTASEPVFNGNDLAEGVYSLRGRLELAAKSRDRRGHNRPVPTTSCAIVSRPARLRRATFAMRWSSSTGIFSWAKAVELADVVSGREVGRSKADSVVLFKSVGLAIEDVAIGGKLLDWPEPIEWAANWKSNWRDRLALCREAV